MITLRQLLVVGLICLSLTLISFYLHTASFTNTMVNYESQEHPNTDALLVTDGFLPWAVDYHNTLPDFKKRTITTVLIEKLANLFNLRISIAFVLINFGFQFFCGFLIYFLARLYNLPHKESLLGMIFFYCSFSILLAYFIPIATYDEPIQYFFILLGLIALRKKVMSLFVLFFTLAIITRENTIILLPGIVLFLLGIDFRKLLHKKSKPLVLLIPMVLPVVFYIIYLFWFYGENPEMVESTKGVMTAKATVYLKNFGSIKNAITTALFFISVHLLPFFLIRIYKKKNSFTSLELNLVNAFILAFCINTPLTLAFGYAEECRVFTLPFLFLFPVFGKIIKQTLSFSIPFLKYLIHPIRLIILLLTTILAWFVFDYLFGLTELKMNENLYREYNAFSAVFIGIVLFYKSYSITEKGSS